MWLVADELAKLRPSYKKRPDTIYRVAAKAGNVRLQCLKRRLKGGRTAGKGLLGLLIVVRTHMYTTVFSLTEHDLEKRIASCPHLQAPLCI